MLRLILVLVGLMFAGCQSSSVWIIDHNAESGMALIGYEQGDDKKEELNQKFVAKCREICGKAPYKVMSDKRRSSSSTGTLYLPQTTHSSATVYDSRGNSATAYGQSTQNVPMQYTTYDVWREAVISCEECRSRVGVSFGSDKKFEITSLDPQTNARAAGLRIGDRVVSIHNQEPGNLPVLPAGQKVEVVVERNGKIESFNVEVVKWCGFEK